MQVHQRGLAAEVRGLRERELHPGAAGGVVGLRPRRRRRRVEGAGVPQRRRDIQAADGAGARLPEQVAAAGRLAGAVHGRRQRRRRSQGTDTQILILHACVYSLLLLYICYPASRDTLIDN
jgi:hypothetical protein